MSKSPPDLRAVSTADLLPLVYEELRRIATAKLARESAPQTLQATALVHEAWLRLGGDAQADWASRRHFFGAAAQAMQQILIERARRRSAVRHGGGLERITAQSFADIAGENLDDRAAAVAEALERLGRRDAAKAELVRLRYFTGLTLEEVAATMEISLATAKRHWAFARAWLARELGPA
jgi:RNA polymerase sigma factor (TIGR02999 family)